MASVTKAPDRYALYDGGWSAWSAYSGSQTLWPYTTRLAYELQYANDSNAVATSCSFTVTITPESQAVGRRIWISLYDEDPTYSSSPAVAGAYIDVPSAGRYTAVLDNIRANTNKLYFEIGLGDDDSPVVVENGISIKVEYFTPTGSTGTPSAPVSTSKSGDEQINFSWTYSGNGTQTGAELQWKTSSTDWQSLGTVSGSGTSYTASAFTFPKGSVSWRVRVTNSYGITGSWSNAASFTVTYPALTVSLSPKPVIIGQSLDLSFGGKYSSYPVTVTFKSGGTPVRDPLTTSSSSASVQASEDWFTAAGVSGDSMSVDVAVSDSLGRTGSDSVTVKKPKAGTATPSAPVSVTRDGTGAISFSWSYSGDGYESSAELEWKASGGDWQSLSSSSVPAWYFPVGSISWRVRVTNSYGLTSSWASASFTVSYPALSLTATPSPLILSETLSVAVTNRLSKTLTATFTYNGTPVRNPMTVTKDSFTVKPTEDWFTAAGVGGDTMSVVVAVSDANARTASTSFTLKKPAASTATPTEPVSVTKPGAKTIAFKWTYSGNGTQTRADIQWKPTNGDWQTLGTVSGTGTSFSAPAYKFPVGSNSWRVRVVNSFGVTGSYSSAASFTVSYAALGVDATPAALFVTEKVTVAIQNRLSRTVTIQYKNGNTLLVPAVTVAADSTGVTPTVAWFETAGASGNSMTVTVQATDDLGRTASDTFTLKKPQPSTGTPTEPVSVTKDGTAEITFRWSYAGDGTQTSARIQWKPQNGDWKTLKTVSGSGTSYKAPAYKFPAGSNSWRVKVTNSYGVEGSYSGAASFSVSYPAMSAAVAQPSVYIGNAETITVENRLSRPLTVTCKYNSTQLAPPFSVSADSFTVTPTAAWFSTAGVSGSSMTVTVAIEDDLGRTASVTFTAISPQGSTATPTSPKNQTVGGAEPTTFVWTVSEDWGSQTNAQLQKSTDGAAWSTLGSVSGSTPNWTAAAVSFPAGTNYWRVRVKNSFGIWGAWSSAASFTVEYAAVSNVVPVNSQTSGFFNKAAPKAFEAALEATGPVYDPFTFASAVFKWRAGTSGEWTEESMELSTDGSTAAVSFLADTFPAGTIQWAIEATDNTGRTTETPAYTLTALIADVEAQPVSPINTVESTNGPIAFRWAFGSVDGSAQTEAELKYSQDADTWTTVSVPGGSTVWEAPAQTFGAGTVFWRVRSKNSANVWGPWSNVVSFKALGAPVVGGVTGDSKPFCTIKWQTTGQEAYEIEIDGKAYGPYFGSTVREYTTREPLSDGSHRVRVRAQNRYSLWSAWAESTVVVQNEPGPSFIIMARENAGRAIVYMYSATIAPIITRQPQDYRGESGVASFLSLFKKWRSYSPDAPGMRSLWQYRSGPSASWLTFKDEAIDTWATCYPAASQAHDGYQYRVTLYNDVGSVVSRTATLNYGTPAGPASDLLTGEWKADTGYFLIYRNGKLIGKTYENAFVDMFAVGTCSYQVIQVIKDGYYTRGTLNFGQGPVIIEPESPLLAPAAGGDFLPLCLTDNAEAECKITKSVKTEKTWYSGAKYPTVEISEEEELSAGFSTFWLDSDSADADALEAMLGQEVVLKLPHGRIIVGVLESLPIVDSSWRRAYSVQLSQMEWSDFVDES